MKPLHQQAIRKYAVSAILFGVISISVYITACIFTNNFIVFFLLFITLIVSKIFFPIMANKILLPVLLNEMDAEEFQKIVDNKRFTVSPMYQITAALSSGDYQKVVNISTKKLFDQKTSIKLKCFYLTALARAYFEVRDFEKLQIAVAKFQEYKEIYSPEQFALVDNSVWEYYQNFLKQDYKACKTICKERNSKLKSGTSKYKFRKLQNNLYYALACYENDDIDTAKNCFETITSNAPKLNIARLSAKYLNAIEQNLDIPFTTPSLVPDIDFEIFDSKTLAKLKRRKIILYIGIAIYVCRFIIADFLS